MKPQPADPSAPSHSSLKNSGWRKYILLAFGAVCLGSSARADSTLLFRPDAGSFVNYAGLPSGYGNRIVSTTQDGFSYGLDGAGTPHVVVDYPLETRTWDFDFGDLVNIATGGPDGTLFELDLKADAGYKVELVSFDMAAWPTNGRQEDFIINSVSVADGFSTSLYSVTDVLIDGHTHTHFDFSGVTASTLKIMFDATNVDSDDIGLTNVRFREVADTASSVPDQANTLVLFGTSLGSLLAFRRRFVG